MKRPAWIDRRWHLAFRRLLLAQMAETDSKAPAKAKPAALRKGALVKVNRAAYNASLEAAASDPIAPDYIFEGPGELLLVKGDYGQVRWNRPVPDVWLRMDQLESCG
ncbi:NADH dehydrogenase I subunit NdhO [Synechococcus sp. A15-24]|nr:NADH dehydrogenase I subunit NdhO [Synechococcus sp. A15-24]